MTSSVIFKNSAYKVSIEIYLAPTPPFFQLFHSKCSTCHTIAIALLPFKQTNIKPSTKTKPVLPKSSRQCDQIWLFLDAFGMIIFCRKSPKIFATFVTIFDVDEKETYPIRPNPNGRINKNWTAEYCWPYSGTEWPNLTIRVNIEVP